MNVYLINNGNVGYSMEDTYVYRPAGLTEVLADSAADGCAIHYPTYGPDYTAVHCEIAAEHQPDTDVGLISTFTFRCTASGGLGLVHVGSISTGGGATRLTDGIGQTHSEAGPDDLNLTCVSPPSPTPTITPTVTPTPTPSRTPTPPVARDAAIIIGSGTATEGELASVTLQVSYTLPPGVGYWNIDVDYGAPWVSVLRCNARGADAQPFPESYCNPNFNDHTVRVTGATYPNGLLGVTDLATIIFLCNYQGVARLSLSVVALGTVAPDARPITPLVENGSITCLGPATAPYTPTNTPTYTPTPTPTPQGVPGDVNCNQHTDAIDAALILQYSAGLIDLLLCPHNGDVNRSGGVNAIDAALILQYTAGLVNSLPAGVAEVRSTRSQEVPFGATAHSAR